MPVLSPLAALFFFRAICCSGVPPAWSAVGVCQGADEVEALSEMRSAHPRSAQIRRPEVVTCSFQVSRYIVDPSESILSRNLFAKEDWRFCGLNELKHNWP
jgi:hypothetical protein